MTLTLAQAFSAARRPRDSFGYWRPAALALPMARRALADLAEAETAQNAARVALSAAYQADSRRYAPALVAARSEVAKAAARWDSAWAAAYPTRPVGKGGTGASLGAPWCISGRKSAVVQWCESVPFRYAGTAEKLAGLRHSGHYLDPDGDGETAAGVVYQMTAKGGRARYVPAIADPHNGKPGKGPAMLALGDVVTAEGPEEWQAERAARDAGRRADQLAEWYAESEREYQEAFRAGQEARERAAEARAAGLGYVAAVKALRARLATRHGLGLLGLSPDDSRGLIRAGLAEVKRACATYQAARAAAFDLIRDSRPGRWNETGRDAWAQGYREGL